LVPFRKFASNAYETLSLAGLVALGALLSAYPSAPYGDGEQVFISLLMVAALCMAVSIVWWKVMFRLQSRRSGQSSRCTRSCTKFFMAESTLQN
jgi:hypothetical protein